MKPARIFLLNSRIGVMAFLLVVFCWLLPLYSQAVVFVVTNNDDSGPGSLRDAIAKSSTNGNAEIDFINFNIPGTLLSDHIIRPLSQFSEITSDLVIDASTQPGAVASVNGAKITIDGANFIYNQSSAQTPYVLRVRGVKVFELYGLVIRDFIEVSAISRSAFSLAFFGDVQKVVLGAAGKGNVFYNVFGVTTDYFGAVKSSVQDLTIKSNFYGVKENGIELAMTMINGWNFYGLRNLEIGGELPAEGNILFGNQSYFIGKDGESINWNIFCRVKNNIFGANINHERPGFAFDAYGAYMAIGSDHSVSVTGVMNIQVSDNVFGMGLGLGSLRNSTVLINRNYFGTSSDQTKRLALASHALQISRFKGRMLIGGTTITEGNVFAHANVDPHFHNYPGIITTDISEANSDKVELSHNSFYCSPIGDLSNSAYLFYNRLNSSVANSIDIFLDEKTATYVAGRTKPGARVELYYTDLECTNCFPKRFLGITYADAVGNWKYIGAIEANYSVMASATSNQTSSEFSDPRIIGPRTSLLKITHQTCDVPNGKIEGLTTVNVNRLEWVDETGQVVGTSKDVRGLPAGRYRVKAYQFGCVIYSHEVIVGDSRPSISVIGAMIKHPACGNGGTISNFYLFNYSDFYWLDQNGTKISTQLHLTNVPAGSYTLHTIGLTGCSRDFGPYVLVNQSGPNIDAGQVEITHANCTGALGSIKNINVTGSGTITYSWHGTTGAEVGLTKDLLNVPEGIYKLKVTDQSACQTIESGDFKIEGLNKISLDERGVIILPTACNSKTGSVKGMIVTGATSYKWIDENLTEVSTTPDLLQAGPGRYKLIVSNSLGCTVESSFISIAPAETSYPNYNIIITPASCGLDNGAIAIDLGTGVKPSMIEIVNQGQVVIGRSANVNNLKSGSYQVFFINEFGCKLLYKSIIINDLPPLTISSAANVSPDNCMQSKGAISGIRVSGGAPPYTYQWKNLTSGVSYTSLEINNIPFGDYQLKVTDGRNCTILSSTIPVQNIGAFIQAPLVLPVKACPGSTLMVSVDDAAPGEIFNLYKGNNPQPVAQNTIGTFSILASTDAAYAITRSAGACESERTDIMIEFTEAFLDIPNTFSPNGDGINDVWEIKGLQKYGQVTFNLFNRYGAKLFYYKGNQLHFDGMVNGNLLAPGIYYYVLNVPGSCRPFSGSLTVLK